MQLMVIGFLGGIGSYLIGSISSAVLICRLLHLPDPRQAGSQNPGTTNVLRIGGRIPAGLTLAADAAKGAIPLLLIKTLTTDPWIISVVLLAAVVGHLYPLFFRFRGGKGVATVLGGLLALSPLLGGCFVLVWLGSFVLTRYSSLSALLALACMPYGAWQLVDKRYVWVLSILFVLIGWRHRSNIYRLFTRSENKL